MTNETDHGAWLFTSDPEVLNAIAMMAANDIKNVFNELLRLSTLPESGNLTKEISEHEYCYTGLQILYSIMERKISKTTKSGEVKNNVKDLFVAEYITPSLFTEALEKVEEWKIILKEKNLKKLLKKTNPDKFNLLFGRKWNKLNKKFLASFK